MEHLKLSLKIASQQEELELLKKIIDDQSVLRWDLQDKNAVMVTQIMQLEGFLEDSKSNEKRTLEDLKNLGAQYVEMECLFNVNNKKLEYATDTIIYQEETIRLVKIEIEKLRASKVNDEHMARKLIELTNENIKLKDEVSALKIQAQELRTNLKFELDALKLSLTNYKELHRPTPKVSWWRKNNFITKILDNL